MKVAALQACPVKALLKCTVRFLWWFKPRKVPTKSDEDIASSEGAVKALLRLY